MAEDEILFDTPWLQVRQRDGWYTFVHTHNTVVYVLPYRHSTSGLELLARFEICPAHSPTHEQTSISGQCPPDADLRQIAQQELHEEGGYRADTQQLCYLGALNLVKFADTVGHLYAIDVTEMEQGPAPGDGSKGEIGSYCEWISREQARQTTCPVFLAMLVLAGL
jgi:hypothetical protein